MPIEVISKVKASNPNAFKVIDASDAEYNGAIHAKDESVNDAQTAIDKIYEIVTAKPTIWISDTNRISTNGTDIVYVSIQTSSPQAGTVKMTITNKSTGNVITYNGPITNSHLISLGTISQFGTTEFSVSAVDNYGNSLVVDKSKSAPGSFPVGDSDAYNLTFYVISGNARYTITSFLNDDVINNTNRIYPIKKFGDTTDSTGTKNITVTGLLQYPDISNSEFTVEQFANYQLKTRDVFYKTAQNGYKSLYKYLELIKKGFDITDPDNVEYVPNPLLNSDTNIKNNLYYKVSNINNSEYVSLSDYESDQSLYIIDADTESVGTFYDFKLVTTPGIQGEFVIDIEEGKQIPKINPGGMSETYDFVPTYEKAEHLYKKNSDGESIEADIHTSQNEQVYFSIPSRKWDVPDEYSAIVPIYLENKYTFAINFTLIKDYIDPTKEDTEESSNEATYDIYGSDVSNAGQTGTLRIIQINDINNKTTDDNITAQFMVISTNSNITGNIKVTGALYYKSNGEWSSAKEINRSGINNNDIQNWLIGRVSRGDGIYKYELTPKSNDGSVSGNTLVYTFKILPSGSEENAFEKENLVAYWDAKYMSNDISNPDMWYAKDSNLSDTPKYYIQLSGLNFSTNGWVQSSETEDQQPHLKFTGDSYGKAYRRLASGEYVPMSVIDLLDPTKIDTPTGPIKHMVDGDSGYGAEMSFEIMFRTRCIGEMKACVMSSRIEESNQNSIYSYSDTDVRRANSGITISHNKAITNTNKDYLYTPFIQDEWKHIVVVVNRNKCDPTHSGHSVFEDDYNPFSSMRIYVDGVLTSITSIAEVNTLSNNPFNTFTQMVLNGHLNNLGEVENCGSCEISLIRMYNKALTNQQVVKNYISSIYDTNVRSVYELKNSDTKNTIPIVQFVMNNSPGSAIRKKNTEKTDFTRLISITDKKESSKYFVPCTMYYSYPDKDNPETMITEIHNNVDVYLQGTSTLQFPVKNFKIRMYDDIYDAQGILVPGGDNTNTNGKLKFIPPSEKDDWVEDYIFTLKCDYMESGHMNNTPTAKFYHHVVRELVDLGIDSENGNVYALSKPSPRYVEDNITGTYKIDDTAEFVKIKSGENYKGTKYKQVTQTSKNSASPSRSYFAFEENEDKTIHFTSIDDIKKTYKVKKKNEDGRKYEKDIYVKYIDKTTGNELKIEVIKPGESGDHAFVLDNENGTYLWNPLEYDGDGNISYGVYIKTNESHIEGKNYYKIADGYNIAAVYDKPNRYYIRNINTNTCSLNWIEYDPTDPSHYGKILYKINDKYRDSVDGFPCIVYYTNNPLYEDSDFIANPLSHLQDMTLLGSMMWNLDKGAKSLGFTVNPVFENDYIEYLKSSFDRILDTDGYETNSLVFHNDIRSPKVPITTQLSFCQYILGNFYANIEYIETYDYSSKEGLYVLIDDEYILYNPEEHSTYDGNYYIQVLRDTPVDYMVSDEEVSENIMSFESFCKATNKKLTDSNINKFDFDNVKKASQDDFETIAVRSYKSGSTDYVFTNDISKVWNSDIYYCDRVYTSSQLSTKTKTESYMKFNELSLDFMEERSDEGILSGIRIGRGGIKYVEIYEPNPVDPLNPETIWIPKEFEDTTKVVPQKYQDLITSDTVILKERYSAFPLNTDHYPEDDNRRKINQKKSDSDPNAGFWLWYTKTIDEFEYATAPIYEYEEKYIPDNNGEYRKSYVKDSNGDYVYINGEYIPYDPTLYPSAQRYKLIYIFADNQYTGQKYKQVFNKYRSYYEYETKKSTVEKPKFKPVRIKDQCVSSYEATTNTKYAAGTFYDITEAYGITYNDDFLSIYRDKYFYDNDGKSPRKVELPSLNNKTYSFSEFSPDSATGNIKTLQEFRSRISAIPNIGHDNENLDEINPGMWPIECFYLDWTDDTRTKINPGQYVYVVGEIPETGNITVSYQSDDSSNAGEFYIYDSTRHVAPEGGDINRYRYKFRMKCTSTKLRYITPTYYKKKSATEYEAAENPNDIITCITSDEESAKLYTKNGSTYTDVTNTIKNSEKFYIYDTSESIYKLIDKSRLSDYIIDKLYIRTDTDDIITFYIDDKRTYIGENLNGSDESYLDYIEGSFETRFSYADENDFDDDRIADDGRELPPIMTKDQIREHTFLPMKRLMKWIIDAVTYVEDHGSMEERESGKNRFRDEFSKHFDLTYALVYYLQMILFAMADNAGKNSMWDTWDGQRFYIRPYDMDTQSGLNNKGVFNVPTSAEVNVAQSPTEFIDNTSTKLGNVSNRFTDSEHMRYNSYTTATSRFWNAFAIAYKPEIESAYAKLRASGIYTKRYILQYYKWHVTDKIGEKYYSSDMNAKYLSQADPSVVGEGKENNDYLNLLMGNRLDQFSKWMDERLIFCDTYFNYQSGVDTLNTQLDIRAQTTNSTAAIGISVFSPQYVKVSVGSTRDAVITAFIDTNSTYTLNGVEHEGILFTLPITGNNKELSIYGGGNIKELYNIGDLKASTLNLGNAKKITSLEIAGNDYIESLNLKNAEYLRTLNVSNCKKLLGNLDISNCINLQSLNLSGSTLSGVTLAPGGNLKEFIASNTSLTSIEFIDLQQLTDIKISNSSGLIPIISYSMVGCPLIKSINLNGYTNINSVEINNCKNLSQLFIESNTSLKTLTISNCDNLSFVSLRNCSGEVMKTLDFSSLYGLETLNITDGKNSNGITIKFPVFRDKKTAEEISLEDATYSQRWHNLKYLLCQNSNIKCITYGQSDPSTEKANVLDFSQLDKISSHALTFNGCNMIDTVENLMYYGATSDMFRSTPIRYFNGGYIKSTRSPSSMFYLNKNSNDTSKSFGRIDNSYATIQVDLSNTITSSSVSSAFYGGSVNDNILTKFLADNTQYTIQSTTKPASGKTNKYEYSDYLVRDLTPHYRKITLYDSTEYVFVDNEFKKYNPSDPRYTNPNRQDYIEIKATYYKTTNNTYINTKFGVVLYSIVSTTGNSTISSEITLSNIDLIMTSDNASDRNALPDKYLKDGTIIQVDTDFTEDTNGRYRRNETGQYILINESSYTGTRYDYRKGYKYYRYYNGSWRTCTIYSYYDTNTNGISGWLNGEQKMSRVSGGIYNNSNIPNQEYEFVDLIRKDTGSENTINDDNMFRIYNPDTDNNSNIYVYKKIYNYNGSHYISSASSVCQYATLPGITRFSVTMGKFLGRCTSLSWGFSSSGITSIESSGNGALAELKRITNTTGMFSGTGITRIPYKSFINATSLTSMGGMFGSCSSLEGFTNGNTIQYYYLNDNNEKVSVLPKSVTNTQELFRNSSIRMERTAVADILTGLTNLTNAYRMFYGCPGVRSITSGIFKDLISVKDVSGMFDSCSNLNVNTYYTIDNTEKVYTGLFVNGVTENLPEADLPEFSLFGSSNNTYPNLTVAVALFCNTSISGDIPEGFFGKASSIKTIGTDYNINTAHGYPINHVSIGNSSSGQSSLNGLFTNTKIRSYHEDFLSRLTNLKDVSLLFAKTSNNKVYNTSSYSYDYSGDPKDSGATVTGDKSLYMYGYIGKNEEGQLVRNPGIATKLFKNNTELENVAYAFAGNKGLWRTSYPSIQSPLTQSGIDAIKSSFSYKSLEDLFYNNKKLKYLNGLFAETAISSKDADVLNEQGDYKITINSALYQGQLNSTVSINDNFFKYYDTTNREYRPLANLITVKSIFERSTIYPTSNSTAYPATISKELLNGCINLKDTSYMFAENEYVGAKDTAIEYAIDIDLFDSCRSTLENTSYMFRGCDGLRGYLPTGNNSWHIAYMKYLENVLSDPDVLSVYPALKNVTSTTLFDSLNSGSTTYRNIRYINKLISEQGTLKEDRSLQIMTFDEFINNKNTGEENKLYRSYYNTNSGIEIYEYFDSNPATYNGSNSKFRLENYLGIECKYNNCGIENNNRNTKGLIIHKIETVYVQDSYIHTVPQTYTLSDYYGLNIITIRDGELALVNLTSSNTRNYISANTSINIAINNEIGKYGKVDDGGVISYRLISTIADYSGPRYIQRSKIYVKGIDSTHPFITNYQIFDIYAGTASKLNDVFNYRFPAEKLTPIYKNRRLSIYTDTTITGNYELSDSISYGDIANSVSGMLSFILTGSLLPEYDKNNISSGGIGDIYGLTISGLLDTSNNFINDENKYAQGLLGSCKSLTTCAAMFDGCTKLSGPIPGDIFSSESPKTRLSALSDISYMFRGCMKLGMPWDDATYDTGSESTQVNNVNSQYNNIAGSGSGMYLRDEINYKLYKYNKNTKQNSILKYLIPMDWLAYTPNIRNANYIFSRLGTLFKANANTMFAHGGASSNYSLEIPSNLFDNKNYITNLEYAFFGSRAFSGTLSDAFLKDSISTIQSMYRTFANTYITQLGNNSEKRIFESSNANANLTNVRGLFANCIKLYAGAAEAGMQAYPRFADPSKFSNIQQYDSAFYGTGFATELGKDSRYARYVKETTPHEYYYASSDGYYSYSLTNNPTITSDIQGMYV